jgi:class 3 adenylate cyclase/DNA-binding CsgD family transcriptional regulator/tetratricopeptide (TPR) repeat protein
MALPAGTVTLLFSDIEGSTRLLERLGDGYAAVLDEHRRIVRKALAAHGGHEVRTEGDAFFVAFERAGDAVGAAVAAQRGLAEYAWPTGVTLRVRMGVHTGEPRLVGGDYVGMDVHRAARICSAAHGGQVVVSETTQRNLSVAKLGGLDVRDLGEHRLKDLARPLRLYQVVAGELSAEFPPLRAQERPPTDLPRRWELARSIVGREPELELLAAFTAGRAEGAVLAVLEGEAGVGKTALWSAAAAHADQAGACVLAARPTAAEAASSYAVLDDLVRRVAGVLPRVTEPGRRALAGAILLDDAGLEAEPRLVALGLLSLLEVLAAEAPVVVAVDDWQWLDAPSEAVLSFLLRRLTGDRVHVLATHRSGEGDDAMAGLLRSLPEGQALEVPLGPLDAQALHRLIHDRTGRWLSPPALARLREASRGNALTALELARAEGTGTAPLVTDVRRLLARRIAALSPAARDVLRCVAALAEPTARAVAAGIDDPAAAPEGLEAALASEALERDGERLHFAHPLFAAVVEERTPPDVWRALHRRLAHAVGDVEQRARHLALAASGPDAEVAAALEAAAAQAGARGAPAAAAELTERAAQLTPPDDRDAGVRRMLAAADAHTMAGDGAQAQRVLQKLIDALAPGRDRAAALCRRAYLVTDGTNLALAEQALAEAGHDDRLLAEIHATLANLLMVLGLPEDGFLHGEAAIEHARRAGEALLEARATTQLAFGRFFRGEGVQRDALVRAARLERRGTGRWTETTALSTLGLQLYQTGELELGYKVLSAELARAVRRGSVDQQVFCHIMLADAALRAGRLAVAEMHARQSLGLVLGMEISNGESAARWASAKVEAHVGRVEAAREHATRSIELSAQIGDEFFSAFSSAVLGFLELSLGNAAAAVARLRPLGPRGLGGDPEIAGIQPDLAEALVMTGDLEGARAVQAELAQFGRKRQRPWAIATALRCRGLIAGAEGHHQASLADLHGALGLMDGVAQPFERARTLLALGTAQRHAKQRGPARASLEAALALFDELRAALWAARARAEIARLGGRPARERDELTPTERRVAELAADGRSNREIAGELVVSERAVEATLTRVYRKLGVRSRTQLARCARSHSQSRDGVTLS